MVKCWIILGENIFLPSEYFATYSKYDLVKLYYISKFRQQVISHKDICCNSYRVNAALSLYLNLIYILFFTVINFLR